MIYDCDGCGEPIDGVPVSIWLRTPLGYTTVKAHDREDCKRRAPAACSEQPVKVVQRPRTKIERAAAKTTARR